MSMARWFAKNGQRCHYCSSQATTRDHIIPRAWLTRVGLSAEGIPDNLVPCCAPCNIAKGHGAPWCKCEKCLAAVEAFVAAAGPGKIAAMGLYRQLTGDVRRPRPLTYTIGSVMQESV